MWTNLGRDALASIANQVQILLLYHVFVTWQIYQSSNCHKILAN